jgi:hypothetical protein
VIHYGARDELSVLFRCGFGDEQILSVVRQVAQPRYDADDLRIVGRDAAGCFAHAARNAARSDSGDAHNT